MLEELHLVPRRSERKPIQKAVVLLVESEDRQFEQEVTTVDMSDHGMRVQGKFGLTPGQVLHLMQSEDPADVLRCVVVWASDIASDGKGEAGLEFLQTFTATLDS